MRGRDLILKAGGVKMSLTAQVQALFAGGKVGGMWDMGDTATLFQDAAGTTPITAVTQPIGRVNDKSGNGNHATQPTAGSRPLFSARKNLLQKTENFADEVWSTASSSLGAATVFSSGNIANLVVDIATNDQHTRITNASVGAGPVTASFRVRKKDLDYVVFRAVQDGIMCWFNVSLGSPGTVIGAATTSISEAGDDFVCVVKFVTAGSLQMHFGVSTADATLSYVGSGIGNYIGEPQLEIGATATRYQRVNTDSDYDTVGFPAFAQFDGINDLLSTAAIDLSASDKAVFSIAFAPNNFTPSILAEFGPNAGGTNGSFYLSCGEGGAGSWQAHARATTVDQVKNVSAITAGVPVVITVAFDLSSDVPSSRIIVRVNGAVVSTAVNRDDTGSASNFTSQIMNFAARAAGLFPSNSKIFTAALIGGALTVPEIELLDRWTRSTVGL